MKRAANRYFDKLYLVEQKAIIANEQVHRDYSLSQLMERSEYPLNSCVSTKDFIHTSLYNKSYGYFNNVRVMAHSMDLKELNDVDDLTSAMASLYREVDEKCDNVQIWHTPTELFSVSHF